MSQRSLDVLDSPPARPSPRDSGGRARRSKAPPKRGGIAVQGSLGASQQEMRDALADRVAQAELAAPRSFDCLSREQQEGWVPYLIEDWFRTDFDPGAFEATFQPFIGDLDGGVRAMLMNGPYVPVLKWRGRGEHLRDLVEVSWPEALDHVVRFHASVDWGRLRLHVGAPRRLGLDLDAVREALAVEVGMRWLQCEVVAGRLLTAYLDLPYWQRQLGDEAWFDGHGQWIA